MERDHVEFMYPPPPCLSRQDAYYIGTSLRTRASGRDTRTTRL